MNFLFLLTLIGLNLIMVASVGYAISYLLGLVKETYASKGAETLCAILTLLYVIGIVLLAIASPVFFEQLRNGIFPVR